MLGDQKTDSLTNLHVEDMRDKRALREIEQA
jgi:hypothetical protein